MPWAGMAAWLPALRDCSATAITDMNWPWPDWGISEFSGDLQYFYHILVLATPSTPPSCAAPRGHIQHPIPFVSEMEEHQQMPHLLFCISIKK